MKKFVYALCAAAVATPAFAADDCAKWRFGRIAMEEGTAPAAQICADGEDHSLMLSCAGGDLFWFRYHPAAGGPERQPGYEGRYIIDIGDDTFRRKGLLEAMDNAIVISDQKLTGPLVAGMLSGKNMTIKPEDGSAKGDTFTLSGSAAAIKGLAAACAKIGN
ncbi:MAG: hypothetical protein IPL47_03300 [Phyllobacteriaceae bacterium]|nr:hypothetical protein [Phyllobacteriaceae bacterium]